jgi:arylsulfatase A-like enzyme
LEWAKWKEDDVLPLFSDHYDEVCDELPPNFDDDLLDKPGTQRQWRWDQQHGLWGYIDPLDTKSWLRHLDYYVKLHEMADVSLGTVLGALDETGAYDDTTIIFTSDHGDMCGSHGLRSKGPFVYEEIMHVPLQVRAPGVTQPGTQTAALGTHVDLASTIVALAGLEPAAFPSLRGVDLTPALADPTATVRDHILFAHDTAHTDQINQTRYAIRGFFDGTTKYARYYGVGGGKPGTGLWGKDPGRKLYDVGAAFEDQEHEWYDLVDDPYEMTNLAHDRSRRSDLRANYDRLLVYEAAELA